MTKIIAEACANHLGDRRIMEAMIKAAADVGVDIIKFQSWKADKLRKDWPYYDNAYQYYKQHELSGEDHIWLMEKCKENNIEFLTTVFDLETVDFLCRIGLKKVKIASPDANNWPLIDKCLERFDEVLISTGMHTEIDIKKLVRELGRWYKRKGDLTLFHCVSSYPAESTNVNMIELKNNIEARLDPEGNEWSDFMYGFSDHTIGTDAAKLAISLSADYIEKHFTLSPYLPGKDQSFSATPDQFKELVKWRDKVKLMMGNGYRELSEAELQTRDLYKGRWMG